MKVLILGGDSLIGKALKEYWKGDKDIYCYSSTRRKEFVSRDRPFIDLSDLKSINCIPHVDSVVICAGETNISKCESKKKLTRSINVTNMYELLKNLNLKEIEKGGVHVVFISSDKASNFVNMPDTEYGKQKYDLENLITNLEKSSILRLGKVIHHDLPILQKWRESLKDGKQIEAFYDYKMAPISITRVVKNIDSIIKNQYFETFNFFGKSISYYDFAVKYAKNLGYGKDFVKKISCKITL